MSLLKRVKRSALAVSKGAGAFGIVRNTEWRRRRLTILCYHGVSLVDEHAWNSSYYMSPESFGARMRLLREGGYSVLPLDEAIAKMREGTLPQGSVALTFDDGMYDFHSRVAPILQRYDLPATVYLTTYYSAYNRPVFDVFCSYLLWKGRASSGQLGKVLPDAPAMNLQTLAGRILARRAVDDHVARLGLDARGKDSLAERLADTLGVDHQALLRQRVLHVMNGDEVRELAGRGIDFQLHTHRHRVPLDRELFLRELRENAHRITELSQRAPVHFCYPSGVHRPEFLPWLTEAGVVSATTCETGLASREIQPLLLPRIVDGEQLSLLEFEGWLSGAAAFLPRRRGATRDDAEPGANAE